MADGEPAPALPSWPEWHRRHVVDGVPLPVRVALGSLLLVREAVREGVPVPPEEPVTVAEGDGVADTELSTPSWFWEDKGYPIRFRMHRFEEHMRQHTIQVDKTLVALGHPPTEAERLVRNLYNALAGLESVAGAGVGSELLAECAAKIDAIAADVERIAG